MMKRYVGHKEPHAVIGMTVRAADVFDEIAKWKSRCIAFVPTAFLLGLISGILVAHKVLRALE